MTGLRLVGAIPPGLLLTRCAELGYLEPSDPDEALRLSIAWEREQAG